MEIALRNIVIDCTGPEAMSRFWGTFMGYEPRWRNATYTFLLHPDGRRPGLVLQKVPEIATEKNRVHFDLEVEDVDATVVRAQDLGATFVRRVEEEGIAWTVMQDPEGNYFCIQKV